MENQILLPEMITCTFCDEKVPYILIVTDTDGNGKQVSICSDCEYRYKKCYYCSTYNKSGETTYLSDKEEYACIDCFDGFHCTNCGDYFSSDTYDFSTVDDETICENCRDDSYDICASCDSYVHRDSSRYCDDCDDNRCPDCSEDHYHEDEDEHNFEERDFSGIHKGYEKTAIIDIDRLVGCEIEVEGVDNISGSLESELPSCVGMVPDGSLSDGVEVITPPASLDSLETIIKTTCEAINSLGLEANGRCGIHIHMDATEIRENKRKLTNLMLTYAYAEDLLYLMLPESRRTGTYAVPVKTRYQTNDFRYSAKLDQVYYKEKNTDRIRSRKTEKYDTARYCGANLHSVFYRGTFEIRYHSGTSNSEKILQWIAINLHIMDYATKRFSSKKLSIKLSEQLPITERIDNFAKLFRLSPETKAYITGRILKFNSHLFRMKTADSDQEEVTRPVVTENVPF